MTAGSKEKNVSILIPSVGRGHGDPRNIFSVTTDDNNNEYTNGYPPGLLSGT